MKQLAADLGVVVADPGLHALLWALLLRILPDLPKGDILEIMQKRCETTKTSLPEDLTDDALADVLASDEVKDIQGLVSKRTSNR